MKIIAIILVFMLYSADSSAQPNATTIIKDAIEYWRDTSSYTEADMKIHRPDWERSMSFKGWTKGIDKSLVRFTAPARDAGNASLSIVDDTWTFNPKINKVMKIPSSMMHQSWMGSDFSYADLSKDYEVVTDYTHRLLAVEKIEGKNVYVVEAVPKEEAAVVWGKEVFKIREDRLMLERSFYDQDMKAVKTLVARDFALAPSGNKFFARYVKMSRIESGDEWTEITHHAVEFGKPLSDSIFTVASLNNPRQ